MKQINVAYDEFKRSLVDLINGSELPMFLVSECLTVVKARADEIAAAQLAEAKEQESLQSVADDGVV